MPARPWGVPRPQGPQIQVKGVAEVMVCGL